MVLRNVGLIGVPLTRISLCNSGFFKYILKRFCWMHGMLRMSTWNFQDWVGVTFLITSCLTCASNVCRVLRVMVPVLHTLTSTTRTPSSITLPRLVVLLKSMIITCFCAWSRILCQVGLPSIKAAEAAYTMTQACLAAAIGRKKPAH